MPEPSEPCELLATCGFFKKYYGASEPEYFHLVQQLLFIQRYCKGPLQNQCYRKIYRAQHGTPPDSDMMPDGRPVTVLR